MEYMILELNYRIFFRNLMWKISYKNHDHFKVIFLQKDQKD
jgi:hypothetical protein